MNILGKAISIVAPRAGLRRLQARTALHLAQQAAQRFSYDGATPGRRAHGWYAPSTDANVELMGSLVWMRNRSRDLIRNNPYAAKMVEELAGNTVGTGIVPQAKTGNTQLDRIIDAEWPYFVEQCDTPQRLDIYGMQALIMRSRAESGESIVRFRPWLTRDGLRVPLQLQLLEADFLDQSRTMATVTGHVMQGVEFDMIGRRVAYWLYKIPAAAVDNPKINLYGTQWTAPRSESVDPVKEAEGVLKDVRLGRLTLTEAILANGYDPMAQLLEIARTNKVLDKLEIILDCDPRNVTLRGQEQPAATEERTPSSKAVEPKMGAALSADDIAFVEKLLAEGIGNSMRGASAVTRTYLT